MLKSDIILTRHALADLMYPVGSYYITESSSLSTVAQMNAFFGGEWTQLDAGRFLEAVTSGAGANKDAGLPNIKGSTDNWYLKGDRKTITDTGAITTTHKDAGYAGTSSGNATNFTGLTFDAHNYNTIYSDSITTVQPKSRTVYVYRRSKLGGDS